VPKDCRTFGEAFEECIFGCGHAVQESRLFAAASYGCSPRAGPLWDGEDAGCGGEVLKRIDFFLGCIESNIQAFLLIEVMFKGGPNCSIPTDDIRYIYNY
jgi:hypothetical protein